MGVAGVELNGRYVKMLPSNSILHSRTWPGLGVAEAGLKDIIALSCVELCVISICHDTAVLTVVHLSRWPKKQMEKEKHESMFLSKTLSFWCGFQCFSTCFTFILWQVSLVNGFFDLVVCSFRIQIHCPAEVHQSQMSLAQLFIHLEG